MLLHGIFPPITTPFYSDGSVYFKKLESNVAQYSKSPVAGIVVLGSTGEAVLLSDRVAVMSPRPGVIRDVVPIELPRPRARELTETVEFNRYAGRLRRSLESAHAESPPTP